MKSDLKEKENVTKKVAVKTLASAEKAEAAAEKTVKKPAKKSVPRKAAVKEAVYLQYLGKEISKEDLMKQVKELWKKQEKRKISELKSVTLYLKPEENAAYYVINDEITGKIDL